MAIQKWSPADAQKYNHCTLIQLLYPVKPHVTINKNKFTHHTSQYTIITTKIILAGDIKLFRTIYLRGEKVQLKNHFFFCRKLVLFAVSAKTAAVESATVKG